MTHQQTAPLGLQFLAKLDQLLALPGNMPGLFLRFARHWNDCQLSRVALQVTRQTLTQGRGIARIGLYPSTLLIEFARRDHVAMRPQSFQLSIETKPKAARFVNHVYRMARAQEFFD